MNFALKHLETVTKENKIDTIHVIQDDISGENVEALDTLLTGDRFPSLKTFAARIPKGDGSFPKLRSRGVQIISIPTSECRG